MPVRRYHPEIRARAAKSAKTFTIIEIPSEKTPVVMITKGF